MPKPNIILTGFMGTGKSSVGRRLAALLDYDFIDTDDCIESRCGKTVTAIFQEDGETVFRQMEAAMARELANRQGLVIATGGRLMLDPANAAALSRNGKVFCLTAAAGEILARVSGDDVRRRPLIDAADPLTRIEALLRRRQQGYRRFTQVETSGKSEAEVTRELIDRLRKDSEFRLPQ
jgi:shikimate kinase